MDCLLLADDLTGAADACAKFVAKGCTGTVLLTPTAATAAAAEDDVEAEAGGGADAAVAVNVDTRRQEVQEATRRVREAARLFIGSPRLRRVRPTIVFKKIDSVLRGHIGAELNEALAAFACTHAIFAPAFPAMGRIVRDGTLFVGNVFQHHIASLLAEQGVSEAINVPVGSVDKFANGRVLICDAVTQQDLDAMVRIAMEAMTAIGARPLWVGSAGLAQALATYLASQRDRARICRQPPLPLHLPAMPAQPPSATPSVLLFIGSPHAIAREQLGRLLDARDVIHARDAGAVRDALAHGRHVLVTSHTAPASPHPPLKPAAAAALATMDAIVDAASRRTLAGFVMSGGDTAADVCRILGADRLRLGGEVADGIPWGLLHGGPASGVPLVLKSGGFGQPDALIACIDFLIAHAAPVRHAHR